MRFLGVIPARFASTRFPGKPLILIHGKMMIQRVYEQCLRATLLSKVVVATDDERIFQAVKSFGGNVVMTSADHQSGTDRCLEALQLMGESFDAVVNIQGDEPFIHPSQIDQLAHLIQVSDADIATLAKAIDADEDLFNSNIVKLVTSVQGKALYFSRHAIPFQRSNAQECWQLHHNYLKHIGLYAYRSDVLAKIAALPVSSLEKAESLEQLRWLENGFSIGVGITEIQNFGIDTPEDLKKIPNFF
ncbi:MAG: 3-deoxy-manno-octulosonate cytidylyltransferase (CMP-KDO synthetase) [Bacteroidetes bacterium]|nr:MAG: 3-deoxy-manno-octulosonate cytidylyltransferase (CMP-KDO synthetase) [Bacteroidota bacterium]